MIVVKLHLKNSDFFSIDDDDEYESENDDDDEKNKFVAEFKI